MEERWCQWQKLAEKETEEGGERQKLWDLEMSNLRWWWNIQEFCMQLKIVIIQVELIDFIILWRLEVSD